MGYSVAVCEAPFDRHLPILGQYFASPVPVVRGPYLYKIEITLEISLEISEIS